MVERGVQAIQRATVVSFLSAPEPEPGPLQPKKAFHRPASAKHGQFQLENLPGIGEIGNVPGTKCTTIAAKNQRRDGSRRRWQSGKLNDITGKRFTCFPSRLFAKLLEPKNSIK